MEKNILQQYEEFAYDINKLKTPNDKPLDFQLLFGAVGLSEEAGEVCGKIKKWIRDFKSSELTEDQIFQIEKELGDCIFYIGYIAKLLNIDLTSIIITNRDKINYRRTKNKINGSGDNR